MYLFKILKVTLLIVGLLSLLEGCQAPVILKITVENKLDLVRHSETVTIPLEKPGLKAGNFDIGLLVKEISADTYHITQFIDRNGDGIKDALIFKTDMEPHSKKSFELVEAKRIKAKPDTLVSTFSRFVPERIDDYAWENDCVAFRTYGPEAERLVKEGETGGTLASGIDCWLKRVDYPIIDKWYRMDEEGKGSYHVDYGEGLDNYHVGSSRGCGGIGIWSGDSLYTSDNFTSYKTLESGPVRTIFELNYAPWDAGKISVKEKKCISIDLGSHLSKIEVQFAPPYPDEIIAGLHIPKHDKGIVSADDKAGWFSYWSGHDGSELGIGIVVDPRYIIGFTEYRVDVPEKSHLFVRLRPIDGKVIYYTGFGWKKSGKFETITDWTHYLEEFAACLISPIEVVE